MVSQFALVAGHCFNGAHERCGLTSTRRRETHKSLCAGICASETTMPTAHKLRSFGSNFLGCCPYFERINPCKLRPLLR